MTTCMPVATILSNFDVEIFNFVILFLTIHFKSDFNEVENEVDLLRVKMSNLQ